MAPNGSKQQQQGRQKQQGMQQQGRQRQQQQQQLPDKRGSPQAQQQQQQQPPRRCDVCGCLVGRGAQQWQQHADGIRHQRNLAAVRLGRPGQHVVSVFEQLQQQQPTLAAAAAAASPRAAAAAASSSPAAAAASTRAGRGQQQQQPWSDGAARVLQLQLSKCLADLVGAGELYMHALPALQLRPATFRQQQLQLAVQQQEEAQEQQQQGQQQQGQQQQGQRVYALELADAGAVACLPLVLQDARSVHRLHLTVPYAQYGVQGAALAGATASLAASLARNPHLQELSLVFSAPDFPRRLAQSAGAASDPRTSRLWGGVLRQLAHALHTNTALTRITLASFPGQFPPEALAELQGVLAAPPGRVRARVALLSAPRMRAGALPRELQAKILEAALPRSCELVLQLPPDLLAVHASSSSSSSSDDDGDEDEDSDTSSSSSSSDDASGSDDYE